MGKFIKIRLMILTFAVFSTLGDMKKSLLRARARRERAERRRAETRERLMTQDRSFWLRDRK